MLRDMYNGWPFFRVTIDLIEMVLAKGDPGIAALYDKLLVSEDLWAFGQQLRDNYEATQKLILQVWASALKENRFLDFFYFLYRVALHKNHLILS